MKIEKMIAVLVVSIVLGTSCSIDKNGEASMFMANSMHPNVSDSNPIKNTPKTVWKFKTEGEVISSPVIQNNTVFIGSNDGNLYALNSENGNLKWSFKTDGPINSTPLVANEKVFFLSYDGHFYCLNSNNGKLVWKFKTEGESKFKVKDYFNGKFEPDFWDFYLSSAIVKENTIYFGSSDAHVYALNLQDGNLVWKYKTGGSIHSSPAISDNSLVVGSWDSKVYCLDITTGQEKWSYTTDQDFKDYIWLGVQASPSIENGVVYIGSRDAKFYALSLESGTVKWVKDEFDRSWMPSSAAIGTDNIYTGSSDSMSFFSINKETGSINYATKTNAYTFSTPTIDSEMAYVGAANGRLFGIELQTGKIMWEYRTDASKTDTIKMFDENGVLNQERAMELSKGIDNMPQLSMVYRDVFKSVGAILSSPTISNQVVYFGSSDGNVYAISDKK